MWQNQSSFETYILIFNNSKYCSYLTKCLSYKILDENHNLKAKQINYFLTSDSFPVPYSLLSEQLFTVNVTLWNYYVYVNYYYVTVFNFSQNTEQLRKKFNKFKS